MVSFSSPAQKFAFRYQREGDPWRRKGPPPELYLLIVHLDSRGKVGEEAEDGDVAGEDDPAEQPVRYRPADRAIIGRFSNTVWRKGHLDLFLSLSRQSENREAHSATQALFTLVTRRRLLLLLFFDVDVKINIERNREFKLGV